MRTLLMVAIGVVLVVAFHLIGTVLNRREAGRGFDGEMLFIWIWLAVVAVDFWVGVGAGNAVTLELGVHLIVFALPAALAGYLSRRRRQNAGRAAMTQPE